MTTYNSTYSWTLALFCGHRYCVVQPTLIELMFMKVEFLYEKPLTYTGILIETGVIKHRNGPFDSEAEKNTQIRDEYYEDLERSTNSVNKRGICIIGGD